jgi:hypothetical protein
MSINFEVKWDVRTTLQNLKKTIKEVQQLPQDAYNYFVSITPIDTGNARRNTSLKKTTIEADYPYAERLDKGWSKQFQGKGMTKPTKDFIDTRIRKINSGQ